MQTLNPKSPSITGVAVIVYGVMSVASLMLAWWLDINPWRVPWQTSPWSTHVVASLVGLLAALPLMALLVAFERWPPRCFARLKESVDHQVIPLLAGISLAGCALLAICAGVGEELLFRGLLQSWLEGWLPAALPGGSVATSILIAGVIFGACHWINDQYALMAALVGMYLGALYVLGGHLLAPIVTHAAYDFFALWYLVLYRQRPSSATPRPAQSPPSDRP